MCRARRADLEEGDQQVLLACFAQDLAEHFDGLAAGEQEAHRHARHTRHLNVVVHVHQLVHQPLGQICILHGPGGGVTVGKSTSITLYKLNHRECISWSNMGA